MTVILWLPMSICLLEESLAVFWLEVLLLEFWLYCLELISLLADRVFSRESSCSNPLRG